jgi:hypothetical protein
LYLLSGSSECQWLISTSPEKNILTRQEPTNEKQKLKIEKSEFEKLLEETQGRSKNHFNYEESWKRPK